MGWLNGVLETTGRRLVQGLPRLHALLLGLRRSLEEGLRALRQTRLPPLGH